MKITIRVFATLRENREKEVVRDVPEGSTVLDVVNLLKLPADDIAIIMINGRGQKMDQVLVEDDVLALFPPVGGG